MSMTPQAKHEVRHMVYAALCLALALVLPLVTGQIPTVGKMLLPMHLPVLLAGFVVGPWWAMAVGFIAPLLRAVIFGKPVIMPTALGMAFELAAYGFFSGFLYKLLPKKTVFFYISLILSMILGRIIWGVSRVLLAGIEGGTFTYKAFIAGAFTQAIPGIILQLVLVPLLLMALRRAKLLLND